jgi:nucleotide-binding universal stress UspA family protein
MKTILVLTDFFKRAGHAAEIAMEIASKANAQIILYHAFYAPQTVALESGVYPFYEDHSEIEQEGLHEMERLTKKLNKRFIDKHGIQPPPIHLQNEPGKLGDNIHKITSKENIWMIVMGDKSEEGAVSRFIFGSNSNAVIDNAPCPVLLVPEKASLDAVKKIVFATELQRSEHKAMLFLEELAELWRSQITVLHVCDKVLSIEEKANYYNYYKKILSGIKYPGINYIDVRGDHITETIAGYARKEHINMIAIVHKKRSFIGLLLHKSISKEMMNYHQVPLLVLNKV